MCYIETGLENLFTAGSSCAAQTRRITFQYIIETDTINRNKTTEKKHTHTHTYTDTTKEGT